MKRDKKMQIGLAIGISVVLSSPFMAHGIHTLISEHENSADRQRFGKYIDDFLTNDNGRPLRLDTNKAINVMFDSKLDEQSKQYIIDGINGLKNICPNLKYDLYNSQKGDVGRVYFVLQDPTEIQHNAAGATNLSFNANSATINSYITIDINSHYLDGYWTTNMDSILTTVVQHELMHTLGFKDIYDESRKNDTIMYHALNPEVKTYTTEDIEKIQYVYGGQTIAETTKSNSMYVISPRKYETEDELILS